MGTPDSSLLIEQGALLRYLSALQNRISQMVQDHAQQLAHGRQQLMRQSVRLMLTRTQAAWGLTAPAQVAVTQRFDQPTLFAALVVSQAEALARS